MNIGIVTTWCERGAAYVSRLYSDALAADHNVFIYARGGEELAPKGTIWDGPNVTRDRGSRSPIPMDIRGFVQWITTKRLDVVFFNEQRWWEPVMACLDKGVVVGSYVDYYTESSVPAFGIFDFLVCNTLRHRSVFAWHPNCHYVPWGTDVSLFAPRADEWPRSSGTIFFHSAGLAPHRKGTDLVIEAFARLTGETRLVLHSQSSLAAALPAQGTTLATLVDSGRCEIHERTVSAPGLYSEGDVYVYPARLDGLGLSLPEALACGLAAITPDHPPMSEFNRPTFGRLVPVAEQTTRWDAYYWPYCHVSIDALAEAMQWYVDHPGTRSEHQVLARQHAVNALDWSSNAASLSSIFGSASIVPRSTKVGAEAVARREDARLLPLGWRRPSLYAARQLANATLSRLAKL